MRVRSNTQEMGGKVHSQAVEQVAQRCCAVLIPGCVSRPNWIKPEEPAPTSYRSDYRPPQVPSSLNYPVIP